MGSIQDSVRYLETFKDFLANRTLNPSRDNAKAILNSVNLPQSMKTAERIQITLACNALTMTDNFWVTDENDTRTFQEVNLRNNHLKDAAYAIAVLGVNASATKEIMEPDISTNGMFPKTWYRDSSGIELWKTDRYMNNVNTRAEREVSKLLDFTNVSHVHYDGFQRDGRFLVKCKCLATDEYSVIDAFALKDWCSHVGIDFLGYLEEHYLTDLAKMCVIDYVVANTDRHLGNINFFVDNSTNRVCGMTPLFDHNQSLVADNLGTSVDDLVYSLTDSSMLQTAIKYFRFSELEIDIEKFPLKCQQRYKKLLVAHETAECKVF